MQSIEVIAPNKLIQKLADLSELADTNAWGKNIPIPVSQATVGSFEAIDLLKRFVITLDARFEKLYNSYQHSASDVKADQEKFQGEIDRKQRKFYKQMQADMEKMS